MAAPDAPAHDAWSTLARLLFSDELHDQVHRAVEAAGLPHPGALKALLHLEGPEAPSMRAIAERLRCDASYVTMLVDQLEGAGLVERRVSPTDRRVKLVHLTPAGRQARDRASAELNSPPATMDRLTEREARTLARLLGKLVS